MICIGSRIRAPLTKQDERICLQRHLSIERQDLSRATCEMNLTQRPTR